MKKIMVIKLAEECDLRILFYVFGKVSVFISLAPLGVSSLCPAIGISHSYSLR